MVGAKVAMEVATEGGNSETTYAPEVPPTDRIEVPVTMPAGKGGRVVGFVFSFFRSAVNVKVFRGVTGSTLGLFRGLFVFPFLLCTVRKSHVQLPRPLLPPLPTSN